MWVWLVILFAIISGLASDWCLVAEGDARWVLPKVLFAMIDGDR